MAPTRRSLAATRIKRPSGYQGPLPAENPLPSEFDVPDEYPPGPHFFENRCCTNSRCRRAIPCKLLKRCSSCHRVTYCSVDCQKADWPVHRIVCEPIPAKRFIRKAVRFNYHCGRYLHAIGLKTLGYDRLPSNTHQRSTLWSLITIQHVAVVNIRRRQGANRSNPFRDFEFMDSHKLSVELLDMVRPGCKDRATALLALRPFEMTFVICLVLYNAELEPLGAQCFLHKVPEFKVNEYPRVTMSNGQQMLNRLLTSKARSRT